MKIRKRKKLEAKGWKVGATEDFLGLSREESEFVRVKLSLARHLKTKRLKSNYSQTHFAQHIGSSQSRVAKMERGDASVSIDLLIHSLFKLGATCKELAKIISSSQIG